MVNQFSVRTLLPVTYNCLLESRCVWCVCVAGRGGEGWGEAGRGGGGGDGAGLCIRGIACAFVVWLVRPQCSMSIRGVACASMV